MQLIKITNLTDVPGPKKLRPEVIDLFNQSLSPGETLNLPVEYFDPRLQKMADKTGKLSVGKVPEYYRIAKMRPAKEMTKEEALARLQPKPPLPPFLGSFSTAPAGEAAMVAPERGKKPRKE